MIYKLTERYLNVFPNQNAQFLEQPLEDYAAEITNCEIRDDSILATVKNSSHAAWQWTDQIRLGVFCNGEDTGLRADLGAADLTVYPGESTEFCIPVGNYPDLLSNKLEIQMLQEGICYFGEKTQITSAEQETPQTRNASILSNTAPTVVDHTSSYNFDITVKNTGSQAWSESRQDRLCIWQDGTDWGYRLYLPDGVTTQLGETYTFTLQGFVLPDADSTYLEFQMLQENVCYFGEKQRVDIRAVS